MSELTEIENIVAEADALYDLMEQCKLGEKWKHDSERFMAFTAGHTRNLVKHSITLSKQTCVLIGLTVVLTVISAVNVYLLILQVLC